MMIDVNPVKAAASKTIFTCVQGLKDLLGAVISEDECLKEPQLLCSADLQSSPPFSCKIYHAGGL